MEGTKRLLDLCATERNKMYHNTAQKLEPVKLHYTTVVEKYFTTTVVEK
jgi:hypothetical protein